MLFILILGAASIVFALAFTPVCRNLMLSLNLVDHADHVRKLHKRAVPRMGGVPVFGSYVAALFIAFAVASVLPIKVPDTVRAVVQLLPATAVVFLVGVWDDIAGLKPWQKLAGQFIAASLACWMGLRIGTVEGHIVQQWWGIPLTVIWLLGCTNAFNLIDGVDGLATGAGLLAAASISVTALLQGNYGLAAATIPMAGALLGFLRYNFNPASIFLGDCGSLVIGFMLGCFAVVWCQKSVTLIGMTAPLMALALPLLDTLLAISRRFIRNQPIFGADRGHIHHRLLDRGHGPRAVTLRLYLVSGVAAIFSLLQGIVPGHGVLFLVLFCVVAAFGIRHLNYVEFAVLGRLTSQGTFRQILQEEIRLQQLEDELSRVSATESSWAVLQDSCADLGIGALEWKFGERLFRHAPGADLTRSWMARVEFPNQGYLTLNRLEDSGTWLLTARLMEVLRNNLPVCTEHTVSAREIAARNARGRFTRSGEPAAFAG